MTRVLHIVDGSCDETGLQCLGALRARLVSDGQSHAVCCLDPAGLSRARRVLGQDVASAPRRVSRFFNYAPDLDRIAKCAQVGLVHAWGADSAVAASARLAEIPKVLTVLSPVDARRVAGWVRAISESTVVATGSQVVRARLVSAGVTPDKTVVIRGPADFAAVNRARQSDLRRSLVGDSRFVILLDGPASRAGGQYYGLWAAAIVSEVLHDLRVMMPYESAESRRLLRFVRQIGRKDMVIVPDPSHSWPQLAACADVFCCPAVEDICTESIAAAMAAGAVVVGSAVRSVAELIADRHNGLLCKPAEPRTLAGKLLNALEDGELRRRLANVARGQAYEVFGVRAFADNYATLYENVLAGRPASEGIADTAMVA